MTEWALPTVVLLASLAATYFFCLRPMRRGNCAMGRPASNAGASAAPADQTAELAQLREQIETLKAARHVPSRTGGAPAAQPNGD